MTTVNFWRGEVLPDVINANTLYFIKPSGAELGKLYLGNTPIANWVDLDGLNAGVKSVVDGDDNGTIKVDDVSIVVYDDSQLAEQINNNTTKIENLWTYSPVELEVGVATLEKGKIYFWYDGPEIPVTLTLNLGTGVSKVTWEAISPKGEQTTGSLTATGNITVPLGSTITFAATASPGYALDSYSSSMTVSVEKTISFTATPIPMVDITLSIGNGVSSVGWRIGTTGSYNYVYSNTTISVEQGSIVTFTATASSGYSLDSYTNSVTADTEKTISFTATPIPMVNITISMDSGVSYVGWRIGTTGSYNYVYSSTTISVEQGSTVRFTYSAETDYSWNSYVSSVVADQDKTVSFTTYYDPQYYVRISVGTGVDTVYYRGGGYDYSTSSGTMLSVSPGTTIYFDAVAETDYVMDSYPSSVNVDDDMSISFTATYVPPPSGPYTITVSASTDVWDYMIYVKGSVVAGGNGGTTESFTFDDGTVLTFSISNKDGTVDSFSYTVTSDDYISF